VLAAFAGVVAYQMPNELVQDGWLTLVSGREVAAHGLHAPDSLAVLTHGLTWINQQWLAQVAFYGLAALGGVKLAMIAHFLVVVGTLGMAMAFARRLGAGPLATAWASVLSMPVALWGWQMRSQNLACPLFVAVLGILLLEGRRGAGVTRRSFLVLPLLAVWANVHGSVLIAVLIVLLFAVASAVPALRSHADRGALLRCGALAAGAVAAVFVSPYGLSLAHYYHSVLGNPDMKVVAEWRPGLALRTDAYPFLVVAAVAALFVVRQRRSLSFFEMAVLALTAIAGFQAIRNALWFSYAVAVVLPLAIDATRPLRRTAQRREFSRLYPLIGLPVLVATIIVLAVQGESWYTNRWPSTVPGRVAAAARTEPGGTVFATERYADWILWREPQLAGRIAYDARFELLPRRVFDQVVDFAFGTRHKWFALPNRYPVVVLGTTDNGAQMRALRRRPGRRLVYQDKTVTVLAGLPRR
jgi:hypothetical protein